jgi:ABC-2 type transport system ATP-binding protein
MVRTQPVIETSDLTKIYKEGAIKAVDGLNLKINKGEIYALIGSNGSGKTTTINMLTGSLFPTSGEIRVLGIQVPKHRRLVATEIGVAPQARAYL